jgi:hypothetical protein
VHGIDYQTATQAKSDIYLTLLPLLNSGRVELLDHPRLITQLCALERRTARGGKDSIDHSPGAHDDVVNAAAGAIVMAAQRTAQQVPIVMPIIIGRAPTIPGGSVSTEAAWREWAYGGGYRNFWGAGVTKGHRPPEIFHAIPPTNVRYWGAGRL